MLLGSLVAQQHFHMQALEESRCIDRHQTYSPVEVEGQAGAWLILSNQLYCNQCFVMFSTQLWRLDFPLGARPMQVN